MRTRIALVAATSVTFIGSTISLAAIHGPVAAAATKATEGTKAKLHQSTRRATRGTTRPLGPLHPTQVTAATLRTAEVSGREVIGTYAPLASSTGRSGHDRQHGRTVTPTTPATAPTTASVPAPVTAASAAAPTPTPAAASSTPTAASASLAALSAPPPTDSTSTDTSNWQCIRTEESGDVYNDPSRPSGAYGILDSTWLSLGYAGWPYQASATVQDAAALTLYHMYGWQPWSSRFACGL